MRLRYKLATRILVLSTIILLPSTTLPAQNLDKEIFVKTLKSAVDNRYKIGVGVSDNSPARQHDWKLLRYKYMESKVITAGGIMD